MADDVVSVERVIPAPPEKIFDLLATPSRHRDIDGSGTVRDPVEGPARVKLGDKFQMSMKAGMSYSMMNEVVEFEEGKRIAWQPRGTGKRGAKMGGRIWRYELEPTEGGTRVRESWDVSQEAGPKWLIRTLGSGRSKKSMTKTLERIEEVVTA
jgi:uncharacterized protein YndB with AHSA1/START domain